MTKSSALMPLWKIWWMAIRPRTLTASIIPVMVATALGSKIGSIHWALALFALITCVHIQIATNLINDALDYEKGADTAERLGPHRVTSTGLLDKAHVWQGGLLALMLAGISSIPLVFACGWPIAILVATSLFLAYAYTGGPYPLAYQGLGDLFVFLFFGLAITIGVSYLYLQAITIEACLAGTQLGCLATVMIAINNLRDHVGDARVAKNTLAVRFGVQFAKYEITSMLLIPYLLLPLWIFLGSSWAALLPFVTLPLAVKIVLNVWMTQPSKLYNSFLGQSGLLHLSFGLAMVLGLMGA